MPRGDHWEHWTIRLSNGTQETPSGCHEWQGSKNNKGYGLIWFDGKLRLAHRAAWLAHHGTWPTPGMVVDHICNNKACVKPAHLRELTNSANIRRAYPRGDERTEKKRASWRRANAKRRGNYRYSEGGESNSVVQSR